MSLVIEAHNYRGLTEIAWTIPPGLSVLVGANAAGKTTLLLLLDQFRRATSREQGPASTLASYRTQQVRYLGAGVESPIRLGARLGDLCWSFDAFPEGAAIRPYGAERLMQGSNVIFEREEGSPTVRWNGQDIKTDERSILRKLSDASLDETFVGNPLLEALGRCRVFYNYHLHALRSGSPLTNPASLSPEGENVFAVLRRWQESPADQPRLSFVIETLKEAFGFFADLGYGVGGNVIEGQITPRKFPDKSLPVIEVANGWLVALVHCAAVADANRGDIIGLDEFENALHPRALTCLLDLLSGYAEASGISVVLTTQSPHVLDWFESQPEKVLVLDRGLRPGPRPLTELRSQEWLAHFRLGREFADGDFAKETEG